VSLAAQVSLLATRVATEFKSVRSAIALKADAAGLTDSGWVDFTCGTGTGMFAGATAPTVCRYRVLNGWVTVQISRTVIVAEADTAAADYATNSRVTGASAVPTVARPSAGPINTYQLGSLHDVPVTCAISSAGSVFVVGGGLRSYVVGDLLDVQFVYPKSA
jgi:hypothetical protein